MIVHFYSHNSHLYLGPLLLNLSTKLLQWKFEVFGNLKIRKKRCLSRLSGIHLSLSNAPSFFLQDFEKQIQLEYEIILQQEELYWFQHSKAKWFSKGDRNTRFFHLSSTVRFNKSKICRLQDSSGSRITDPNLLSISYPRLFY